jgi:hypothetical protein
MLNILIELCKKQQYASFYTDLTNSNKFIYGRVLAVDKDNIALYLVSPDGVPDGIVVKRTCDIIRVEVNGLYAEKMQKLIVLHHSEVREYDLKSDKIVNSILLLAHQTRHIISIEILNSGYDDVVGFVNQLQDDLCVVKQIDMYGHEDGMSYIQIPDITQISYDSGDEKRIMDLWQLNQ